MATINSSTVYPPQAGLDMKLVFDAMRVSSGNSFCWETEVPRMLKGDYYPDFTAEMMHKVGVNADIRLDFMDVFADSACCPGYKAGVRFGRQIWSDTSYEQLHR